MRNFEGTMRLQGIGIVEGIKAKNILVGDILVWNNGGTEEVIEIEFSKTGKTLVATIRYYDSFNKEYKTTTRKLGSERIVCVKELNKEVEEIVAESENNINDMEEIKMKKEYIIEQMAETRWFFKFTDTNEKGEKLIIELSKCEDWKEGKNSLPKLWKKNGYIDRVLETYWSIETYVKDTENNSYGRYNPQHKLSEDKKRMVINFDWMFEATEENKEKLINEVYRLFSTAKGETATEEKHRKIREFAKNNNVETYNSIPEGWSVLKGGLTSPVGTVWISNMESFKTGNRKHAILIAN